MKVYISGPIKGIVNFEENFANAEKFLQDQGYDTANPCIAPEGLTYEDFMRFDLYLLLGCDAIYMLKGWEQSRGAFCEFHVAVLCGMRVMYE